MSDKEDRRREAKESLEAWEGAKEDLAKAKAEGRPKPVVHNGTWLNAQQIPPIAWAVPGLFPEGMTFLGGGPKAGKSWLSQAAGLAIASGRRFLGSVWCGQARPVLYFALEDSDRRIKARSAELGWPQMPELFWYTTKAAPDQVLHLMRKFLEYNARWHPVAVIDTWGKIMSPAVRGETTYDRDYRLGSEVKRCVDDVPGSSVIINHHTRKEGAADFIDTLSGTFGVAGSADTIAILTRKRGEDTGLLQVTGRDVEEGSYSLVGFPCWALDGGGLANAASLAESASVRMNLGDRSAAVLDLIESKGRITSADIASTLSITPEIAGTYLGRLVRSGRILKVGRGEWAALGVESVESVENPGSDQETLVPTVESVESVENLNTSTLSTGESRARTREDDIDNPDFQALWEMSWKEGTG